VPHANDSADEAGSQFTARAEMLARMLRQGRSWSGHERNCCFLNTGQAIDSPTQTQRFANISAVSGFDWSDDGRAVAPVDWDHDGDLDLWTSSRNAPRLRLLRNNLSGPSRFLALRLIGNGKDTNRDAIGARVEVVLESDRLTGDREASDGKALSTFDPQPSTLIKTLHAGEGFLSQGSKWLHFGLGEAAVIEKVVVRWPGAEVQEFTDVEANKRYLLVQGEPEVNQWQRPHPVPDRVPSPQQLPPQTANARVPVMVPVKLPPFEYPDFDNQLRPLNSGAGNPLLINLWATWCHPCLQELKEFTERAGDIGELKLDILALSVDGLGDARSGPGHANVLMDKLGFPFRVGLANSQHIDFLQNVHDTLMPMSRPLPVPTSFLLDGENRLQVIYKGPVDVDTLLRDVDALTSSGRVDRRRTGEETAITIDHPRIQESEDFAEAKLRFQFGQLLFRLGLPEQSAVEYQEVVRLLPKFATGYVSLGAAFHRLGSHREAQSQYQKALQLDPNSPTLQYNLGILYLDLRDFANARAAFEKAIELKPRHADAHCDLGAALGMLGDVPGAVAAFEEALRIDPKHENALKNLSRIRTSPPPQPDDR
jgi:tetratricopeptide (TPR) repeat protein